MKANKVLSKDEDCKSQENSTVKTTRGDVFNCPDVKPESDGINLKECERQDGNEILEEPTSVNDLHAREGVKIDLKKNEMIRYKINESDEWIEAKVLNRAGKDTGIYRNWFNVKNSDGMAKSIDLDNIKEWEKVSEEDAVCIVVIPKEGHEEEECVAAKWVELNKLKEFDVYEVPDEDQFRISTTWVLWNKGKEVRARLVARGYEDMHDYPKDSPTINKTSMRIILAITVNKGWKIQTTDVKSAFLQGKLLDREVFLSPPKEIKRDGFLWRLKRCLYGLNDAARQFYQCNRMFM